MKLIIAGSRHFDESLIASVIEFYFKLEGVKLPKVTEVISGKARGVDTAGEYWASTQNIPVAEYPANWEKYGKMAGHKRNQCMAHYGDALLVIWDGYSKGSSNMKSHMIKKNKPVYEIIISNPKHQP